jgi:hypothetical protein
MARTLWNDRFDFVNNFIFLAAQIVIQSSQSLENGLETGLYHSKRFGH